MAFADAIVHRDTKRLFGFLIELPAGVGAAYDFYVASERIEYSSVQFQPFVMSHSNLSQEMRQGDPISRVSDLTLTLKDAYASAQTYASLSGPTLSDLLQGHDWHNAPIRVYLLAQDVDGTWNLTTIWWGNITEWEHNVKKGEITLRARAMLDLEAAVPTTVITQATHADPPDSSVGVCEPLVYGDLESEEADPATGAGNNRALESMGYARLTRMVPAICYDKASDDPTANVKYRAAGHDLKDFEGVGQSYGAFYYVEELKQLAPLINADFTTGAGVADLELNLSGDEDIFSVHIDPQWVNGTYNTATNPERAMNRSISNYATVDPSNPFLALDISKPPDLGYMSSIRILMYCAYDMTNGGSCRIDWGLLRSVGGTFKSYSQVIGGSSAGVIKEHLWTGAPTYSDRFVSTEDYAVAVSLVNHAPGDYVQIRAIAMIVKYYPRKILPREDWPKDIPPRLLHVWERHIHSGAIPPDEFLDLGNANSKVFIGCEGKADDGSGTMTGSANSLIEAPGDILHDALRREAGITSIAVSGHGSMRTVGDDQAGDNIEMAFSVNSRTTAGKLAQKICHQSGMGLFQRRTTGYYGLIYWGSASSTNDYGTAIDFDDVIDLKIGMTSIADVKNDLHTDFDYSSVTRKFTRHAYQDKDGDDDGDGGSAYTSTADFTTSESRYGKRAWNLKSDLIHNIQSACVVRNIYADMLVAPRVKLRLRLPWKYYDIELGHLIEMDDTTFRVDNGVHYPGSFSGGYYGYWSQGANHHYFWVERVTFDKRGFIEIEATEGVF